MQKRKGHTAAAQERREREMRKRITREVEDSHAPFMKALYADANRWRNLCSSHEDEITRLHSVIEAQRRILEHPLSHLVRWIWNHPVTRHAKGGV